MTEHVRWEDLRRELDIDKWKKEHPWEWRRIIWHDKLRVFVYKLTRYDIG